MVTWGSTTVFGGAAAGGLSNAVPGSTQQQTTTTPGTGGAFSFASSTSFPPTTPSLTSTTTNPLGGGGSIFGNAPSSSFGSFLGSNTTTPIPTTTGSIFGSPAPSSAFGGLGGGGGSLFGTSTTSTIGGGGGGLFGSSLTSQLLYGQPQMQQQQQHHQVLEPHDVYRAVLASHARREEIRVTDSMKRIYEVYTGTAQVSGANGGGNENTSTTTNASIARTTGTSSSSTDVMMMSTSVPFTTVLYNPANPQQRQLFAASLAGAGGGGGVHGNPLVTQSILTSMASERPNQISYDDWNDVLIRNPDPMKLVPIVLNGADSLAGRLLYQQQEVHTLTNSMESIERAKLTIEQRHNESIQLLHSYQRKYQHQRSQLLGIMKKIEILRCANIQLQSGEMDVIQKIRSLQQNVEQIRHFVTNIQQTIQHDKNPTQTQMESKLLQQQSQRSALVVKSSLPKPQRSDTSYQYKIPNEKELMEVLKSHRTSLSKNMIHVQKDLHDLHLIQDRVLASTTTTTTTNHHHNNNHTTVTPVGYRY